MVGVDGIVQAAGPPQLACVLEPRAQVIRIPIEVAGYELQRRIVLAATDERHVLGPEPFARPARDGSADLGRRWRRRNGKRWSYDRVGEAALREVELQQEPLREEPEDEEEEQTERRGGERREPSPVGPAGEFSHPTYYLITFNSRSRSVGDVYTSASTSLNGSIITRFKNFSAWLDIAPCR